MQFSIPTVQLNKPLQQVIAISPSSGPNANDITSNICMEVKAGTLILKSTDNSLECSCTLPLVDIVSEGRTTINAQKLSQACKSFDNNSMVSFKLDEDKEIMYLNSENTHFEIRTRNADEFPSFDMDQLQNKIVIKQKFLKELFELTSFCVSTEDFREYLRGIRLECTDDDIAAFSSDGHRMAIVEGKLASPVAENIGVTLTKKFCSELSKIITASEDEVVLNFSSGAVQVELNNFKLCSNLIVCSYPNVRAVIPKVIEHSISVPRLQLKSSIQRVSIMSSKRINAVSMYFEPGLMRLSTENTEHEQGNDSFAMDYQGSAINIALNASYVVDILNVLGTQNAIFAFAPERTCAVIEPEASTCDYKIKYVVSKVVL